jgi:gliding motility-associated-like protein
MMIYLISKIINFLKPIAILLFLGIVFVLPSCIKAQNLVPDSSFEDYIICPNSYGQIDRLKHWKKVTNHTGTPDYYNTCAVNTLASIPINTLLGDKDVVSGNGYIGLLLFYNIATKEVFREYVVGKLIEPLKKNTIYKISFIYSVAKNGYYITDAFGIYFSNDSIVSENNNKKINVTPQLKMSKLLDKRDTWEKITFTYLAKGGERFFTFGNFNDDNDTKLVIDGTNGSERIYLFIDDFSVYEYSKIPSFSLPNDTVICEGDTFKLQVNDKYIQNYLWQDGRDSSFYTITKPGLYYVTASNEFGSYTDSINVSLTNCNCLPYFIPTAFTPNNDGLNDFFVPIANCEPEIFNLSVYNRWGEMVFITNNNNEKWDGKKNGKECTNDVYYYILNYKLPYKTPEITKGMVTLIR